MHTKEDIQIYIHHPVDVPFAYADRELRDTILWGSTKEIVLKITEIINDPVVKDVPISLRRCRFSSELLDNSIYDIYSFSTCLTNCYHHAQVKYCEF